MMRTYSVASVLLAGLLAAFTGACADIEERIVAFDRSFKAPSSSGTGDVGEGAIVLSPSTQSGLAEYLSTSRPRFFVVATHGRNFAASSCGEAGCSERGLAATIADCERQAESACKLYAQGREVVWQP